MNIIVRTVYETKLCVYAERFRKQMFPKQVSETSFRKLFLVYAGLNIQAPQLETYLFLYNCTFFTVLYCQVLLCI